MIHASGKNYGMKQLAWHLLSNLQSSGDYLRSKFNNDAVWKVTLREYHNSTAKTKKNIVHFIATYMFCSSSNQIRQLLYPLDSEIGTENDKTDVRIDILTILQIMDVLVYSLDDHKACKDFLVQLLRSIESLFYCFKLDKQGNDIDKYENLFFKKMENDSNLRNAVFDVRDFYLYQIADKEQPIKKIFDRIVDTYISELDEQNEDCNVREEDWGTGC